MRLFCLASLVLSMIVSAGEIQQASVEHKDGVYTLELDVVVASQFAPVHAIIRNSENLDQISDVLIETSLLGDADAEIKRRRLVVKTCILFFCFTAKMVEDVWENQNSIVTEIIPELSDYKFGKTKWQVIPVDEAHSRIKLYCELEPDFWIPPLIGPYLMKQKMMSEAQKTIYRIEELTLNV
jgi:hypothetical protein